MLPASFKALLRSTGVRLSAIYAGLLILTILGAGVAGWIATAGLVERQASDRLNLEAVAIAHEVRDEGLGRAAAAVIARSERPGALEYGLYDPQGRRVAGDLVGYGEHMGLRRYDLPGGVPGLEGKEHLLALTSRMPDGSTLTVAEDLERTEAVRDVTFFAYAVAGTIALALGLVASFLVTRRLLRRMALLTATMEKVSAGDLSARVAIEAGGDDDMRSLAHGLNDMLDRIDRLVATVRRVSADLAHDLRTPLSHVRQRIELASQAADEGERSAALASANDGIDAALRLFDAMLRLAEIDAGAAKRRFAPVDLNEVAERVADAYRPDIESAGLKLSVVLFEGAVAIGEADLIAQAIANLVENAQKHAIGAREIAIRVEVRGDCQVIAVEDDGCGIAERDREMVRQPFGRLDRARTSPGSGLGLAIAEAVARIHGGSLRLDGRSPGLRASLELCSGK